jgi:16S rRNA (cytosine967-C5)-methyltransferase
VNEGHSARRVRVPKRRGVTVDAPGLASRRIAADILHNVLHRRRPLDEQLQDEAGEFAKLNERDRALVRALTATVLRRLGTLRRVLARCLEQGYPAAAPRVEIALLLGAAQILWLEVPDHAAVDLAVRLLQLDRAGARYRALVNAVLRRIARERAMLLNDIDPAAVDTPDWLMSRWIKNFGPETAREIALAHGREADLDLTVKGDPQAWAQKIEGHVLPTGTVRAHARGPLSQFPGYEEGAWWVQDAAAALPARLFGALHGKRVADLCAAPGGKTAQLAAAGADVVAVDRASRRLDRLRQNLLRLQLSAEIVCADVTEWQGGQFDAVLLDAPCSSTGTIRRHPDIPWLKRASDIDALAAVQRHMIRRAADLVRPGGILVYCVCSLEPEEGWDVVHSALAENGSLRRSPIAECELNAPRAWFTSEGDLRTLPCHWADPGAGLAGLDGFYAARLQRI